MGREPSVKINPLSSAAHFLNEVRERREHEDASARHQRQGHDAPAEKDPDPEESFEKVADAVKSFQDDEQAKAAGINATVSGGGPGLRVVLKDGSGAVVRQLTGEEFLRLREVAGKRGKILDQKF
jgi:hypothetical protein